MYEFVIVTLLLNGLSRRDRDLNGLDLVLFRRPRALAGPRSRRAVWFVMSEDFHAMGCLLGVGRSTLGDVVVVLFVFVLACYWLPRHSPKAAKLGTRSSVPRLRSRGPR